MDKWTDTTSYRDAYSHLWKKKTKEKKETTQATQLPQKGNHQGGSSRPQKLKKLPHSITMDENGKKYRQNGHLIIHFPMSEGVSEVSEREKQAGGSKLTSERCEHTSKWASKWHSTAVYILGCYYTENRKVYVFIVIKAPPFTASVHCTTCILNLTLIIPIITVSLSQLHSYLPVLWL